MIIHERSEWLAGYQVAAGEGEAWWGGPPFETGRIDNITWHFPGGRSQPNPVTELHTMQADYHRRTDADHNGRPPPFSHGYNLGYNAVIDRRGEVWKVRWFDQRCAANGAAHNRHSFAVQFMMEAVDGDITDAQRVTAREMDKFLRERCSGIPAGRNGHRGHRDFVSTGCPGDRIYGRMDAGGFLHTGSIPRDRQNDRRSPHVTEDDDMRFINLGSFATFSEGGSGYVHWINSPEAADLYGVPAPKPDGTRGLTMPASYFRTLVLVGPMPQGDQRAWSAADFAGHKPDG